MYVMLYLDMLEVLVGHLSRMCGY